MDTFQEDTAQNSICFLYFKFDAPVDTFQEDTVQNSTCFLSLWTPSRKMVQKNPFYFYFKFDALVDTFQEDGAKNSICFLSLMHLWTLTPSWKILQKKSICFFLLTWKRRKKQIYIMVHTGSAGWLAECLVCWKLHWHGWCYCCSGNDGGGESTVIMW